MGRPMSATDSTPSRPQRRWFAVWVGVAVSVILAAGIGLAFAVQRVRDSAAHMSDT